MNMGSLFFKWQATWPEPRFATVQLSGGSAFYLNQIETVTTTAGSEPWQW